MEKLAVQKIVGSVQSFFSSGWWKELWTKDWVLKLISLVLAVMLWYFVDVEDTVDKTVMVPIEIINLPRDLVISNQFKKELEVTVTGPRSEIQAIMDEAVTRQINLADTAPGTNVIHNDVNSIQVPKALTILRIQPSSIILSLDKLIKKEYPVSSVTVGKVAQGYVLKQLRMEPNNISITGPQTILSQLDDLPTKIIDVNEMKGSKQIQIPLDLQPDIEKLIGETTVTAEIVIEPETVEKKINGLAVRYDQQFILGEAYIISPEKVDVIARIPLLRLEPDLDLSRLFKVTVEDTPDDDFLKVKVKAVKVNKQLPIEIVSVIPSVVKRVRKVQVTEEPSSTNPGSEQQNEVNIELLETTMAEERDFPVISPVKTKIKKL